MVFFEVLAFHTMSSKTQGPKAAEKLVETVRVLEVVGGQVDVAGAVVHADPHRAVSAVEDVPGAPK